ncbi:MAG: PrgI family mobile element protein [Ktedonobacterales bacterium]
MHDVPTHLEIADKLVFGLTAGQTLFSAAGIFVGYSLWKRLLLLGLPVLASLPLAALASLLLISLGLIRPEERSLDQWGFILLRYLVQPKVYLLARAEIAPAANEPVERLD